MIDGEGKVIRRLGKFRIGIARDYYGPFIRRVDIIKGLSGSHIGNNRLK